MLKVWGFRGFQILGGLGSRDRRSSLQSFGRVVAARLLRDVGGGRVTKAAFTGIAIGTVCEPCAAMQLLHHLNPKP